MQNIGFMQGRLSPLVNGKIQAFPWGNWQNEFSLAAKNGFNIIEWTLDQERLYDNPLMNTAGREEIRQLMSQYNISIPSLTGDCFMQAPFYKLPKQHDSLLKDLNNIVNTCAVLDVKIILIPLVDNGRLDNQQQEQVLLEGLAQLKPVLKKTNIRISFESDFEPLKLAKFIGQLESEYFGITYDIGNSAALGYKPNEEIKAYGHRIINVHIKDRLLGGTTVPLGQGDADIPAVLKALSNIGYNGNYILQTARADNNDHVGILCQYRNQVIDWLTTIKNC